MPKKTKKSKENTKLQIATGMRYLSSDEIKMMEYIRHTAFNIYSQYGSERLETPTIERSDIINHLYGENFNKEVFWVGEEREYFMRYDLTVPAALYVGNKALVQYRRHQFGPVYRRDQPNFEKGRFRQFTQCDFDIYGDDNNTGLYDIEIVTAAIRVLETIGTDFNPYSKHYPGRRLSMPEWQMEINDKRLVFSWLRKAGVPEESLKPVCSTIDKLDKRTHDEIAEELTTERKLSPEIVRNIMGVVTNPLWNSESNDEKLKSLVEDNIINEEDVVIVEKLQRLLSAVNNKHLVVNPLLARGLDYYTGVIYEVRTTEAPLITFASGGRYDNMLEIFSSRGHIPAVGFSIGVDRLITVLKKKERSASGQVKVLIASVGKWEKYDSILERHHMAEALREYCQPIVLPNANPRMKRQLQYVFDNNIPVMIVIGEAEAKEGVCNVKYIKDSKEFKGVKLNSVIDLIQQAADM